MKARSDGHQEMGARDISGCSQTTSSSCTNWLLRLLDTQAQKQGSSLPETSLEGSRAVQEVPADAEALIKHAVEQAPLKVPLQGLREHEALPHAGRGHIQGQDAPVQHANEVVLLAHDAGDDVMLRQVPDQR